MVICLERGADLHMAQLMPLPLTVSCFSSIQTGFTFLIPAHPSSPRQRAVKHVLLCLLLSYQMTHVRRSLAVDIILHKDWRWVSIFSVQFALPVSQGVLDLFRMQPVCLRSLVAQIGTEPFSLGATTAVDRRSQAVHLSTSRDKTQNLKTTLTIKCRPFCLK